MASTEVEILSIPSDLSLHYYPPSLTTKHGITSFAIDRVKTKLPDTGDVSWQPNLKFYEARAQRAQAIARPKVSLEWPDHLDSPLAWKGQDLHNADTYTYHLTNNELEEIDRALVEVRGETSQDSQRR
jgi:hypothetical protein